MRRLRERALLTQEELAHRSGLSIRTVRGLESNRRNRPRAASIRLVAGALGLSDRERAALLQLLRGAPADPAADGTAADDPEDAPDLPAPAPASWPRTPAQLPADVADFTGRADSLRRLDALLAGQPAGGPGTVVITAIAGTAGVGKTALAVHWAHRVAQRFPDGQLYVNLRGYGSGAPLRPIEALALLLGSLGVGADRVPVEVAQATGLLRSLLAGRRMLLVADNARDAEQVRPLLPGTPGCVVVVTSRDRLTGLVAIDGAHRLTLDVLAPQEAVGLLARVLGPERAAVEPAAIAELARVCAYLPLALRIAAAKLSCEPGLSAGGYVAALRADDLLAALAVEGDPQAAVVVAFNQSYRWLDPEAARLFRLLGVVPCPTVTVAAAAAVAGIAVPQARRLAGQLADAHLLEPRQPGRFAFHDLVRRYAQDRARQQEPDEEREAALGRLLGWYRQAADAAARLLYPEKLRLPIPEPDPGPEAPTFAEHADALGWLDSERANLVATVAHAAQHGPRPFAWLLAHALRSYFFHNLHLVDWLTAARAGLAAAEAEGDLQAQAAMRRSLGDAHECLGDYAQAAAHYTSAITLARQAGWVEGEAVFLGTLGLIYTDLGESRQAADLHVQALALHRRSGYTAGQAIALGNLGNVYLMLGRPAQAADHIVQALDLHRELGSKSGQAIGLNNLGEAHRDLGQLDRARECLSQALTLAREISSRYGEAYVLHGLATVERDAGRHTEALELAEAALAQARELREARLEAEALNTLGGIRLCLGRPGQAAQQHRQALELARQAQARYPEADTLLGLAAAHLEQAQPTEALQHAQQALTIASQGGYLLLQGRAHTALAAAHLGLGDLEPAVQQARQALEVHREGGHRLAEARALLLLDQASQRARGSDAGALLGADRAAAVAAAQQPSATDLRSPDQHDRVREQD